MAPRQATCTSCQHSFRVTSSAAGEVRCPKCGGAIALVESPGGRTATARGGSGPRPSSGKVSHARRSSSGAARERSGGGGKSLPLWIGGGALVAGLALWFFVSGSGDDAPKAVAAAPALPSIDLSKIPDVEPLEGTDPGDWEKMKEMMARYVTPPWGPSTAQYGDRLMIKGRHSVPAILNAFKRLDLSTPHGADVGWKIQALLLQGLCKDTNFGWRRDTRPEDVAFNQEIVQRWLRAWEFAGDDDATWTEIAKHKGIPPGLQKPAPAADTPEGDATGGSAASGD